MLSEFQFEDWRTALTAARRIAPVIARLKARAYAAGVPVVYVNDMAGRWQSDQQQFVARCLAPGARGRDVARQMAPAPADHFIFKPKHSGFYGTPLAELLGVARIGELILTGTTSHQCVLFTAMDAYVRDYRLVAPRDCIASPSRAQTSHALFILEDALRARTPLASRVLFQRGTAGALAAG